MSRPSHPSHSSRQTAKARGHPDQVRTNPAALPIPEAAGILTRACGREIPEESIRADIRGGAPVNQDGTVNLVHYGAWLIKKAAEDEGVD